MAAAERGDGYLARVIRVLEAFDSEVAALKVSVIAASAGLPLPTAYRIVADLVEIGFLARDGDGRIRLGARLWELANRGSPLTGLREAARTELIAIHAATGQHTNLAVLREGSVLVVDRIVADTALRNRSVTAMRMSATRSSLGLAMLAHAPLAQVRLAVALAVAEADAQRGHASVGAGGEASGDDGVFAAAEAAVRRELDGVRRRGYAVQRGKQDSDTMGVAVAVLDGRGDPIAAVGVIVPIETTPTVERAMAERLRLAAARIAAALATA